MSLINIESNVPGGENEIVDVPRRTHRDARNKADKMMNPEFKKQQQEVRNVMLDQAVRMYQDAIEKSNKKYIEGRTFKQILAAFDNPPWMARHTIYNHYKRWAKKNTPVTNVTVNNEQPTEISDITVPYG
jgi:uncharacterized protein (DUF1778 family)